MAEALVALGMSAGTASTVAGIGTVLSTVGSLASSFGLFGGDTGPQAPPPVQLPPAAPLPEPPAQPATLASEETQRASREDFLRRTRLREKQLTARSQLRTNEEEAETRRPTLLGA